MTGGRRQGRTHAAYYAACTATVCTTGRGIRCERQPEFSALALRQSAPAYRDTIPHTKDTEGTVYVLLEGDARTDERSYGDGTHDRTALVEALQSEIAHLREEARRRDERHAAEILRRDHIIAAALERIPALDAPAAPESAPAEAEARAPPRTRRAGMRPHSAPGGGVCSVDAPLPLRTNVKLLGLR